MWVSKMGTSHGLSGWVVTKYMYCIVAALSAYVCYYALDSGGLVGLRMLLQLNGCDSL